MELVGPAATWAAIARTTRARAGFETHVIFLRDWIHRIHGRWFKLSAEKFDAIHYTGIMIYKLAIFMFNLVPYLALLITASDA